MRVGLYGGSFNPAHAGHAHVAETAARRLGLDRVIWLVSPQNPLKPVREMAAAPERMASAHSFARRPRMIVTDVEARFGSPYTVDTLRLLKARHRGVRFVWVMGADGLADFHRWRGWTDIARLVPFAVVARPGETWRALTSPAARRFAFARRPERAARALAFTAPPAWTLLSAPLNFASSTVLRRSRDAAKGFEVFVNAG